MHDTIIRLVVLMLLQILHFNKVASNCFFELASEVVENTLALYSALKSWAHSLNFEIDFHTPFFIFIMKARGKLFYPRMLSLLTRCPLLMNFPGSLWKLYIISWPLVTTTCCEVIHTHADILRNIKNARKRLPSSCEGFKIFIPSAWK